MCGINGILSQGSPLPDNVADLIRGMNQCIQHRGPDDTGLWINPQRTVAFGHQRLSIIDLSPAGHQPMLHDAGHALVFNGEIYNYNEIKSSIKDYHFKSNSDTEVLLELYHRKGHAALHLLNGMFAFAFWNAQSDELLLARDRAGKKPLYYSTAGGYFSFSSEIRSLLTLPWIKAEADPVALYHFLTFNQLNAPETMFRNIFKTEPGTYITANRNKESQPVKWWDITYTDYRNKTADELSVDILSELRKSVKYRMVSDVPVGAFLSGGVDSSAVVALMREVSSGTIKTYSVGFKDQPAYDETKYAELISKRYNTDHFEKIISAEDIAELLPHIAGIFDEPLADSTAIPIHFISEAARANGSTVVQTGDGADELFAGYRSWMRYKKWYPWYNGYMHLPLVMRKAVASLAGSADNENPLPEMLARAADNEDFFWGGARAFREHTKRKFLNPSFLKKVGDISSYEVIDKLKSEFKNHQRKHPWLGDTDWMCFVGFKQQIPWKYLYRMDRIGMAHSIEIRSPFLDYNFINLALSIPADKKLINDEPKGILKRALEPLLPHEVLYRKKMGFNVPLKAWADQIMGEYIETNLHDFCANTEIFDEKSIRDHLKEIRKGNASYSNNLWTVYFLMAWFKRWMPV